MFLTTRTPLFLKQSSGAVNYSTKTKPTSQLSFPGTLNPLQRRPSELLLSCTDCKPVIQITESWHYFEVFMQPCVT